MPAENIRDVIKSHWESLGRNYCDVPEWNTRVFWRPITMADHQAVSKAADAYEYNAEMLIRKLEYEDGAKVFDGGTGARIDLLNFVPDFILERIRQKMEAGDNLDEEQAEELKKPSARTPDRAALVCNNGTR
jgi:hypothetical protein